MRIALVSPYDWSIPGGVNSHVAHLAREFRRQGHDVRIVAPSSRFWAHPLDNLEIIGKYTVGLPASGSVAHISLSFTLAGRVRRLLQRERFDLVHLHEPFMPLLPFQFLRFYPGPVVATFHAAREGGSRLYAYARYLIRPYWGRIDGRIAVSRTALRLISKYFAGRYRIIPNGVDVGRFSPEVEPLPQFDDGKLNVLFLGRLERRKGLPYLLQAFALLKREMPQVRLIVVGRDGGMLAPCQRFVERTGLSDVVFVGYVPEADLPRYYRSAHVFCAPNTGAESQGLILLEAMASGVPVVASAIEGFREVISDGQEGLLVSPGDGEALAQALLRLLSDPALREAMGQRGLATVRRYAWERVATEVLDYYRQVIAQHYSPAG
ncbi:MAG: glycosyltransferase family 4 protein [Dehalococcoidia bacterium]|jgi:phosphatidylinositol alpha-mannosyltransferase|nr:glycosyltransferase family 4 protein [Dehalococcoidia bacterium]MDW8009048.1 glycosyltransferase family 4 protein [Chloroflexota bacterium]